VSFKVRLTRDAEADLDRLFARTPSPANGLCFCAGSFGILPDADLPAMIERFGSRIGFLHLRAIELESEKTFYEAAHLEGNAGMAAVVDAIYALSVREGRSIPMRPDHGHQMMDDLNRKANPGYSLLGRMRGLAFQGSGHKRVEESKVADLERKIGQQTLEIDFLRKALQH